MIAAQCGAEVEREWSSQARTTFKAKKTLEAFYSACAAEKDRENAALKEQVAMLSGAIQALKDYEETPVPHFEWDKHYEALYSALAATKPKEQKHD